MTGSKPGPSYADQFRALDIWGRSRDTVSPGERSRVDATVELVPSQSRTVLDVGCGDGLVTNELAARGFAVTGVDLVPELLRHVRAPVVEASADSLPFDDGSFDCVIATAVLEHLPAGMFEASVAELTRVAAHHLVIGCPHREDLALTQARCGRCLTVFHASHHVRSVDVDDIAAWFAPAFEVREVRLAGEVWPFRSHRLQRLAQVVGNVWYRGEGIVCPTCGYAVEPPHPSALVRLVHGAVQRTLGLVRGARPSEVVVLLERAPSRPKPRQ